MNKKRFAAIVLTALVVVGLLFGQGPVQKVRLWDTNLSHSLLLNWNEDRTAGYTLNWIGITADRTITLQGNPTLDDWFDQSVKTTFSPTFVTVKLSVLTDGYFPYHVADATGLANSVIRTDGTLVGVGMLPTVAQLEVNTSQIITSTTAAPYLKLINLSDTARDPIIQFAVGATPVVQYTMGVDDSWGVGTDAFKVAVSDALGTEDCLIVNEAITVLGHLAGASVTGDGRTDNNVFIGNNAGTAVTTGGYNTFVGDQAGMTTTDGDFNTFIGSQAGMYFVGSWGNVILGESAGMYFGQDGSSHQNVIIGDAACEGYDEDNWGGQKYGASHTVVIGGEAAWGICSETSESIFIGDNAGLFTEDASCLTALGPWAASSVIQAIDSVIIGGTYSLHFADGVTLIGEETDVLPVTYGMGAQLTAVAGTGLGIGEYGYLITAIIDGEESAADSSMGPGSDVVTTTTGNQKVHAHLRLYPKSTSYTGFNCTARKIYRTKVNGHTFFYLATVADNTTVDYDDTAADATLTVPYDGSASIICLGRYAYAYANHQMVIAESGTTGYYVNNVFFNGVMDPVPQDCTLQVCGGRGTNIAAADLIFAGGRATGNAASGDIIFKTGTVGASGTALQTLAERFKIQAGTAGATTAYPITSTLADGTAPLVVTSTTVCTNLNTGLVDGFHHDQSLLIAASPTFVALNLSATSNQIVLQSAGVTGTITATPASSNKTWTLQNVTGTIYQTNGTDVAVADGGTGKSSFTQYAIPYASAATTIGEITIGTAGQVLAVNGGANGYTWSSPLSNPMTDIGDMIIGGAAGAPAKLADVAVGSYLRSGGVTTAPLWSTLTLPNTGTAYRLPVFSATNVMTELAAVGATGEYLKGNTGAIPSWATLNQAAVAGLTTADGPTFDHVHLGANHIQTTTRARAYRNGDQLDIANNTYTKVQLNAETYDSGNNFDSSTDYRFVAPVAGYYAVSGAIAYGSCPPTGSMAALAAIYVNGTRVASGLNVITTNAIEQMGANISDIIYLAASNYVELYAYQYNTGGLGTVDILGGSHFTYLSVHLLSIA